MQSLLDMLVELEILETRNPFWCVFYDSRKVNYRIASVIFLWSGAAGANLAIKYVFEMSLYVAM